MATGLIGTSSAFAGISATVTGSTLTYTCPASGVRYSVVSVTASVSATTSSPTPMSASAGSIRAVAQASTTTTTDSSSSSYSVILGPGQSWSGYAEVSGGAGGYNNAGSAILQASALEVV